MSVESTDGSGSVAELDEALQLLSLRDHKFREQAIRTVQANRVAAIPRLIQGIDDATSAAAAGEKVEGNLAFFSLSLLTEFRAKEALPAILKALSLPGDGTYELFGDLVHELLRLTLSTFCADSIETVDELVSNRSVNEYVRWSSAGTYLYLVRDGRLTRDEAVERLRKALQTAMQFEDYQGVTPCVMELFNLSPVEALEEIRMAYERHLMDESLISLEEIESVCIGGTRHFQEELGKCLSTEELDTVEFLRHWNWVSDQTERKPKDSPTEVEHREPVVLNLHDDSLFSQQPEQSRSSTVTTIRSETPHVGRNDPCPCGSGKKFKKCCGAN